MDKAYLFVHFKGTESAPDEEQIYFAVSKNALEWQSVNGGKPVLTSCMGEGGVRDPHILRTKEGGFVIIATDLSIYSRTDMPVSDKWTDCQCRGSKDIALWRSDDLVNWSEQKMVRVAAENAGCTWAPETAYDHKRGEYMVFWASKTADDNFTKQRIWRAYTKDFENFSEPEIYIDREYSVIDTTIIYDKGIYYRFTKNETDKNVFLETSDDLSTGFVMRDDFSLGREFGYEGPTLCPVNDGIMLYMDNFAKHEGYKTFFTESLESADFKPCDGFKTPYIFRHGTVIEITQDEYNRIVEKMGK